MEHVSWLRLVVNSGAEERGLQRLDLMGDLAACNAGKRESVPVVMDLNGK